MNKIARRDFLKVAPAAAGVAVSALGGQAPASPRAAAAPAIGSARYTPVRDYPIQPKRPWDVAGLGGFDGGGMADNVQYWASSQQTADMAAHVDFADLGRLHGDDKDFPRRVRAIRMV